MARLIKAAEIKRQEAEKQVAAVERPAPRANRYADPRIQFEDLFRKDVEQSK